MSFMSEIDEENREKEIKDTVKKLAKSVGLAVSETEYDGWENMFVHRSKYENG